MIDLSDKTDLALVGLVANEIRQCGVRDFLIVGAQARDILLTFHRGIATGRATRDVDFGVMVESWQEFSGLRQSLLASGRFSETASRQRLRFGELPVDLVPFGGIETVARTIVWPQEGRELNTVGFREALVHSETVRLPGNIDVQVAALPTQALLKLLTWSELQLDRVAKDAQDFRTIAKTYCNVAGQERLTNEQELLKREDFDYEAAGAWLLGHDAGLMHREAPMFAASANAVFTTQTGRANLTTLVASMGGPSMEENVRLAEWFRDGLQSGLK